MSVFFVCLFVFTKLSPDWGNIEFWTAQTKPCVHQDPGERSSDPTIDWARLAVSVPESAACRVVRGTDSSSPGWRSMLAEWRRLPLSLPQFGLRPNSGAWGEYSPTHQQKIWLKIYWSWPCEHFPHNQSLPSGSMHKSFILTHQRPHRMETAIRENYK